MENFGLLSDFQNFILCPSMETNWNSQRLARLSLPSCQAILGNRNKGMNNWWLSYFELYSWDINNLCQVTEVSDITSSIKYITFSYIHKYTNIHTRSHSDGRPPNKAVMDLGMPLFLRVYIPKTCFYIQLLNNLSQLSLYKNNRITISLTLAFYED